MKTDRLHYPIAASALAALGLAAGCSIFGSLAPGPEESETTGEAAPATGAGAMAKSPEAASPPATPAGELSLRQRDFARSEDEYFQSRVDDFERWCGYPLEAHIDWVTFREEIDRRLDGTIFVSFFDYCGSGVEAMSRMCQNHPDSREVLQSRVHHYVCRYGGPGLRAIELRGDTLTMAVDWDATYYDRYVDDYLGRVL